MQKDSTMAAADAAGLGRVALMQEPVAAVMSVMRQRKNDGVFVVYDLGGGTLDIAIAESISGRVTLLAHGGIAMRSEEHTSELQSLMRISYAVFCLKKKKHKTSRHMYKRISSRKLTHADDYIIHT